MRLSFSNDNLRQIFVARLKDAGCKFSDPFKLPGFNSDFSDIPDFGLYDVFNHLICFQAENDRRKLRAYKSFEGYRLFSDGHVLDIKVTSADSTNCTSSSSCSEIPERKDLFIFRAEVKPMQKDKTYSKVDRCSSWIVLHAF